MIRYLSEYFPNQQSPDQTMTYSAEFVETLSAKIKEEQKATYYIGKYYFAVHTLKRRSDYGLKSDEEIDSPIQQEIQRDNEEFLFHEYIHFVHEISTVLGNVCLGLDMSLKSIFSHFFNSDLGSSEHMGIDKTSGLFQNFVKFHITLQTLNGSVETGTKLLQVSNIELGAVDCYMPHGNDAVKFRIDVPTITAEIHEDGIFKTRKYLLGKFFIYESIAYELDREFYRQRNQQTQIIDDKKGTEYTFLRIVAHHIYPDVSRRALLTLASLSLTYLNAGAAFVKMMSALGKHMSGGADEDDFLSNQRSAAQNMLFDKLQDFNEAQDEIVNIFEKRPRLKKAFETICQWAKNAYMLRAEFPTVEIDTVLNGRYASLLEWIPVCDYMYQFLDEDEFNRDMLGTTILDEDSSQATKVLIAYDHYQKSHELLSTAEAEVKETYCCPFYTCCNLPLRIKHGTICNQKPWRIFEVSYSSDKQYCWYGQAVAEFKGHTEK